MSSSISEETPWQVVLLPGGQMRTLSLLSREPNSCGSENWLKGSILKNGWRSSWHQSRFHPNEVTAAGQHEAVRSISEGGSYEKVSLFVDHSATTTAPSIGSLVSASITWPLKVFARVHETVKHVNMITRCPIRMHLNTPFISASLKRYDLPYPIRVFAE